MADGDVQSDNVQLSVSKAKLALLLKALEAKFKITKGSIDSVVADAIENLCSLIFVQISKLSLPVLKATEPAHQAGDVDEIVKPSSDANSLRLIFDELKLLLESEDEAFMLEYATFMDWYCNGNVGL